MQPARGDVGRRQHPEKYLLDPGLDRFRNPYDPQFRRACDLYNESLESAMRIVQAAGRLMPGQTQIIKTGATGPREDQ